MLVLLIAALYRSTWGAALRPAVGPKVLAIQLKQHGNKVQRCVSPPDVLHVAGETSALSGTVVYTGVQVGKQWAS